MIAPFRTVFALVLAALLLAAKAPAPVQIEIEPEQFAQHVIPAGYVPPGTHFVPSVEAGLCQTRLAPQTAVNLQWRRLGERPVTASVTLVRITMRMQIDVYLQDGAPAGVAAHEATHRAISEHFYATAEPIARDIADAVLARKVRLPARDQDAAARRAVDKIEHEILAALNWRIYQRCEYAQDRFDTITDHGRKSIANRTAMQQALTDEAAHWEKVRYQPPPEDDAASGITM